MNKFNFENIKLFYEKLPDTINNIKNKLNRPLTLTEKILYAHLYDQNIKEYKRGVDYINLKPDRVAMQDATAQMALLQFINSGKNKTEVPVSIHCDHLITAENGAEEDLNNALKENKEVYDFLKSISLKYGIDYWQPGAGIIHQIILENYAFPLGMIIGTDSHTPNSGGLTMLGIGVGGADAVDAMVGLPWELKFPKIYGIHLKGKLQEWSSPKDVILKLLGLLTVKGGTGAIIEYFGEGTENISCTGKATICNMGAELGATSSIFPFDMRSYKYLCATNRKSIADLALKYQDYLKPDQEVLNNPDKYYDKIIEIDLDKIEPSLNGPFTPDLNYSISEIKKIYKEKDIPQNISACLLGSCTNSSYEDIDRATNIIKDAINKGLKLKTKLYISPGSEKVRITIEKNGQLDILKKFGAIILANACGPCIGMWKRKDIKMGEKNTILTTFNRNFQKRADGNPNTLAFITSPELLTALAIAGNIDFDPRNDYLVNENGEKVKLSPPYGEEIPEKYYDNRDLGVLESNENNYNIEIIIPKNSDRLQLLEKFPEWDGNDIENALLLVKIKGKCTTDHISMAGEWLKYRGHLDNISNNLFLGVTNAFTNEVGITKNLITKEYQKIPQVARYYKNNNIPWIVIGDENYGEGSSREHAAMEPRYLNGKAIIVKSFARIHETNLKKQGILALTFSNPYDYNKIQEDDKFTIKLNNFKPGIPLTMIIHHSDGSIETILLNHTYNEQQIEWFKAGSALNLIAKQINNL